MQLLKSILPDKIIARIQGVSWRQQASKHTREPAVTLTHLRKHSMRTCNGVSSCFSQRLSFSKPHGGAYLDCSLQGQKFIADSHQRVTVMFSGEDFWGHLHHVAAAQLAHDAALSAWVACAQQRVVCWPSSRHPSPYYKQVLDAAGSTNGLQLVPCLTSLFLLQTLLVSPHSAPVFPQLRCSCYCPTCSTPLIA